MKKEATEKETLIQQMKSPKNEVEVWWKRSWYNKEHTKCFNWKVQKLVYLSIIEAINYQLSTFDMITT